jgi:Na+/melibiose symporter-like transporter
MGYDGRCGDHSEWVNHRRATGFVFAGIVFALKAGLGIGVPFVELLLIPLVLFPNVVQTESALFGIRISSSIIPALTFVVGVFALLFYPISKHLNEKIQQELAVRRSNKV